MAMKGAEMKLRSATVEHNCIEEGGRVVRALTAIFNGAEEDLHHFDVPGTTKVETARYVLFGSHLKMKITEARILAQWVLDNTSST